jgi:hypothetical protein
MRSDLYSGFLRPSGALSDVKFSGYSTTDEQCAKLRNAIESARRRGLPDRDITILTFCAPERSSVPALIRLGFRIVPAEDAVDEIGYTSIFAFKGMESRMVILTDLDLRAGRSSRALLYTALTRSTGGVEIVANNEDMDLLELWLREPAT